ncbi:internal virion protein [Klebsiella phage vB_Kpl_K59PH2]|uniref:Internal virion protein n=1 Tax=Klebsiella phage vB_Kpl_K59PH2 TaxID=3071671 RepID=A0AAD2GP68_9CAUD|nr:internal virion protein [Klebsiella phage vB_Kpl_K59PH2]
MAETPVVQAPGKGPILPQPSPVQVQVPLASQVAQSGVRPTEARFGVGGSSGRESMDMLSNIRAETLRSLSAFSPLIAEKLKQAQEDEFANGYMRQLQGETVDDIRAEQPDGGFFGDGSAVRGAQARQAETAGQSMLQYVQQNQGELTRMDLESQRRAIGAYVEGLKTGDPSSDLMIAQGVMKMMPAVLDNLARTAESENQRQAQVQQADAMAAAGDSLRYAESAFRTGQMGETAYNQVKANYIQMAGPLPGQTNASYRAALTGQIMQLSKDGSHEMANLLYDNLLHGQLTADERLQMEGQIKASRAEWLLNNPTAYDFTEYRATLGSQIDGGRYSTQAELEADIDRYNADYKAQTGSLVPLIDNKEKGRAVSSWLDYKQRADAANQKLMASQMDEAAKMGLFKEGYAKGSPSQMQMSGLDSKQKYAVEATEAGRFMEGSEASARVLGRLASNGYTNPVITEQIGNTMGILRGGGIPKAETLQQLQQIYGQLKATPYGAAATDAYFKEDLPLMERMAGMDMTDKSNVQAIREMANANRIAVTVPKDVQTAAAELVDDEFKPGVFSRWFGDGIELGVGYEAQLKDEMKKHAGEIMAQSPNSNQKNVLEMAKARTLRNKDIAGNMLITGSKPGQFVSAVNQHLNVKVSDPKDTRINTFITDAIKPKMPNGQSFNVGSVAMLPNGESVVVTVTRANGGNQSLVLSLKDIADIQNNKRQDYTRKYRDAMSKVQPDPYVMSGMERPKE